MRCLTLAEALVEEGMDCTFALGPQGKGLFDRFASKPHAVLDGELEEMVQTAPFDAVILDDYRINVEQERRIRERAGALVVVDDLADRPHACDLLVDTAYGRRMEDYEGLLPAAARGLFGPQYALVRPAFARLRPGAVARPAPSAPERLLLCFGLSDVAGIAARAVDVIRKANLDLSLDVALASSARSATELQDRAREDRALHLHFDAAAMADLMAVSDLVVGAGGVSTFERCSLGRPAVCVVVAENQRLMAERLDMAGAQITITLDDAEFEARLLSALETLWGLEPRLRMAERAAAVCDGQGAQRVAAVLKAL